MLNSGKKQNFISLLKETITKNLTDIEARDDCSTAEQSSRIIHIFSALCAVAALQPVPFADILLLVPLQIYMAARLIAVHGVSGYEKSLREKMTAFSSIVAMVILAQQVALGLYKTALSFPASFALMPLIYGLTYAIGKVLDSLFIRHVKEHNLNMEQT